MATAQHHIVQAVKSERAKCRTDLLYLCNEILGYKDINRRIHGEVIDALQKFPAGTDYWTKTGWIYTPGCPIYNLRGNRRSLTLITRDSMKTTLCSIAHSIQWILAYPNVRILMSTATAKLCTMILQQVKEHFISNVYLRELFPEHCPQLKKNGKVDDFGNAEQFTTLARTDKTVKEPTFQIATVETKIAGQHVDVAKNDDIVDRENARTPGGLQIVKDYYSFLDPIVDHYQIDRNDIDPEVVKLYGNHGWIDNAGTRYDFSDAWGGLLDADRIRESQGLAPLYNTVVKSALLKGRSAYDADAVALWEERLPLSELQKKESADMEMTFSQYYLNPIPSSSGLVESEKDIVFIPRKVVDDLMPRLRLHVTVDLHGMEPDAKGKDNDYTAMVLAGFGRDGRPYVVDIFHGRPDPFEVIETIFTWYARYPRIIDFKIQKDHFMRTLAPFLKREQERRRVYPIIVPMPISNDRSKVQKIRGLRPWFRNGDIRFVDDLKCRNSLINEIMRFPKYNHDDLLDAIADQLENREGGAESDVIPIERIPAHNIAEPKFYGFQPGTGTPMFSSNQEQWDNLTEPNDGRDPRTGY